MRVAGIALGLIFLFACWGGPPQLRAADEANKNKKSDAPQAEQKDDAKSGEAEQEEADPYQLPEKATVKQLLDFMKSVQARRTQIKTQAEAIAFQTRGQAALRVAGEKIEQIATDDDKKLPGYTDAVAFNLVLRASASRDNSPGEVKELAADIKNAIVANEAAPPQQPFFMFSATKFLLAAATQLGVMLEYNRHPELHDLAAEVYRELGTPLAASKDAEAAKTGEKMIGAARRLDLPGKPFELTGTEMDGSKFDWAKYRGKVVLVDFWATWCRPCLIALPDLKRSYQLFHDLGFEVVGISMDRDRNALEQFMARENFPWVILSDGDFDANPLATQYGIFGIPNVILVDKEGKVVSTAAQGPELDRLLTKLLGEPKPPETEKPDSDAPKDQSGAGK